MTASLVEILRPRAQAIAEGLSRGLWAAGGYRGGSWRGYYQSEQLVGALIADDGVMYHRPGYPQAKLWLTRIRAKGIANVEFGEDSVVQDDLLEQEHDHYKVPDRVVLTTTIEHTFDHLTTREDDYKQQLEVAFKESLRFGGEKSKIGGGLEAMQDLITAFEQKYGAQEDKKDVARRVVSVAGPKVIDYTATRKSERVEQPVSVNADLSAQVNLDDETQVGPAQTWWQVIIGQTPPKQNRIHLIWDSVDTLLEVFKGQAPIGLPLSPQFTAAPLDSALVAIVERKPEHANWVSKFFNVIDLDIDIEDEEGVTDLGNPDLIPLQPAAVTPPPGA